VFNLDKRIFSEYCQPMQIIVFDKKMNNIGHFINCNIGGLPLKWNRTNSFDSYPLKLNGLREPTRKVKFAELLNFINPSLTNKEIDSLFTKYDYIYVVYFSRCFYSLSKSMFKNIDRHLDKFKHEKLGVLYIFNEDIFVHLDSLKK
jgi:hypothetical protein